MLPVLSPDSPPRVVHAALLKAVRLRQGATSRLMELLRAFKDRDAWRVLGFDSMSHYIRERLGMSTSAVKVLLHLHGRLAELPRLRQAFGSGRLHQSQAELLAQVASRGNEQRLIELAANVVVRRLRDMVSEALERRSTEQMLEVLPQHARLNKMQAERAQPKPAAAGQTCAAPFAGSPLPPAPPLRDPLRAELDPERFDDLLGDGPLPATAQNMLAFSFWLPAELESSWLILSR
jgi:hypothetical protein